MNYLEQAKEALRSANRQLAATYALVSLAESMEIIAGDTLSEHELIEWLNKYDSKLFTPQERARKMLAQLEIRRVP